VWTRRRGRRRRGRQGGGGWRRCDVEEVELSASLSVDAMLAWCWLVEEVRAPLSSLISLPLLRAPGGGAAAAASPPTCKTNEKRGESKKGGEDH